MRNRLQIARNTVLSVVGHDPEDFDADALQWMADGPLLDAVGHFYPAGKLTMAETRAREAAAVISSSRP